MAALESEQAAIVAELELGDVFSKDAPRAAQIANRLTEIEAELLACLTRWEELEAKVWTSFVQIDVKSMKISCRKNELC